MECASSDLIVADNSNFRRSYVFTIRAKSFDQLIQTRDTTGDGTDGLTYLPLAGLNTTYTPNQLEHLIVLGYAIGTNLGNNECAMELRNVTDASSHVIDSGDYNNGHSA